MADSNSTIKLTNITDIDEFLDQDEAPYNWLVEGLLERGDRLILTGGEGMGKSTLLRQMAIQISAGIHPFTHKTIPSRAVLLVDLENPPRILRRKLKEIRGDVKIPKGNLRVAAWPEGIDFRAGIMSQTFFDLVEEERPEVLIIGPIYKMWGASLESEEESKLLSKYLDRLRNRFDLTLIIEAHQPHMNISSKGGHYRPGRPIGASLWMRWPEFGLCLFDDGKLVPWRGARDEREWPDKLARDGEDWPWEIDDGITDAFCQKCNKELSEGKRKFCSTKCADASRKQKQREKAHVKLPEGA